MTIPTQKLIERLKNITKLVQQAEQGIVSNVEVQRTHPERIANVETWLSLANQELKLIREEDEVGVSHWEEISDALPMVIDRLNNQLTLQQNMDFIMATDKQMLERFISSILLYGLPLFKDALRNMTSDDLAKLENVISAVKRDD